MTKRIPPYSPEVRSRAVRMVLDHQDEHGSQWAAIQSIASKIGCSGETLRSWVRQAERDDGARPGPTSAEKEELARLRREVRELRQANEILQYVSIRYTERLAEAGIEPSVGSVGDSSEIPLTTLSPKR